MFGYLLSNLFSASRILVSVSLVRFSRLSTRHLVEGEQRRWLWLVPPPCNVVQHILAAFNVFSLCS